MADAPRLLCTLIEIAERRGDATAILHDAVVLERLDGTRVEGLVAVVDAIGTRGTGARLTVLSQCADAIEVSLSVEGVPGRLRFTISATVSDGRLHTIRMNPAATR